MSEMKSLTLNDKKYDGFVDPVARELAASSGVIISASGENISISDSSGSKLFGLNIYGKTTQAGTPTPDVPVDLVSVGNSGSITVTITGENDGQSMVIATPNGLPGIPVAEGGNYTDETGQQWICDEIDLARGVCVQSVTQQVIATNTDSYKYEGAEKSYVCTSDYTLTDSRVGLCSHYQVISWDDLAAGKEGVYFNANNSQIIFANTAYSTLAEFKAFVAEQHAAGTPLTVVYPLVSPNVTTLSEEEIAAYKALHTYRGHTTVSNDASAHMELAYGMDTKKYIDSMIAGTIINATVE